MDAALIGKGRLRLVLAGDIAFQLLDVLGLLLNDGFDQITDGQHADDAAGLEHR